MSKSNYQPVSKGYATRAVHFGQNPEQWDSNAIVTPLVLSVNFKHLGGPGNFKKYGYSRCNNPTRDVLEHLLASLEGTKYGLCYSSGVGAISSLMGLLKSGDHIICAEDVYGGSYRVFADIAPDYGFEISLVDVREISNIEKVIKPNTKLIFMETVSNPILRIADIRSISALCKKRGIIIAVDNTFETSYFTRPIELGADLTVYSLTKYMNGHTDVTMGAILMDNEAYYERLRYLQSSTGNVPAPFDCLQVNRSLKTLALRMRQHSHNAIELAKFLEAHPKVEKVVYPGLKSHPQHELHKSQSSGHSGMLGVYLKADLATTETFLSHLKLFILAGSLGGVQSLIALSKKMTHSQMPPEMCDQLGITDNFLRVSVGVEDTEDLIEDWRQALDKI